MIAGDRGSFKRKSAALSIPHGTEIGCGFGKYQFNLFLGEGNSFTLGNDKASFALAVGDKEFNPGQVLASDCCTFRASRLRGARR